MVDIQAMLKCGIFVSWDLYEVLDKRVFRHCEWLCDDDVVPIREERKGELNEVQTASFVYLIDAE